MRFYLVTLMLLCGGLFAHAVTQTIHLKEYLGHTWTDELISYPLDPELAKEPRALGVLDAGGKLVPFQVHQGRIYLLVTLPADGELTFTVKPLSHLGVRTLCSADQDGDLIILDSKVMSLYLPSGEKTYPQPIEAKSVMGPLQGVSQGQGPVIGKSWLDSPLKVAGYKSTITAIGPLFAEATVDYTFENGKHYTFTARVIGGQPTAIIDESMDLNPGGRYAMLKYDNDADASTWEWWSLSDSEHLGVKQAQYPRASLVFSLKDGLQPNQAQWVGGRVSHPKYGVDAAGNPLMNVESGRAFVPLTYAEDERVNRIAGFWLNSFSNYSHAYTVYNDANPNLPAVSISSGRASRNVNPNLNPSPEPWIKQITGFNDLAIWTKPATKDLQVIGPICLGTRQWLLTVEPQSALPAKASAEWPGAFKAHLKYARYQLDKIKDWSFDWEEPKNAWPRLFCKAGDLAGMQARVQAAPASQLTHGSIPAIYRKGGTSAQMAKQSHDQLKAIVDGVLDARAHGSMNWFHASLHMFSTMPIWEAAMGTPDLDPKMRAKIKAYGAFIAQRAWDDDYWPPKETNNGWGSVNMGTLAGTARVITASAMAGMPGNEARLRRCRGYLDGNLQPLLAEDGSAVSCPHYIGASMDPILYMALALKYGGDYDAFKRDPRVARFGQFMIDILTPPDPRSPKTGPYYGQPLGSKYDLNPAMNRRNLWPLGHTSRTEPTAILDMLALGYQGVDDRLAGVLNGVSADMGKAAGGFIPAAMLSNSAVPSVAPTLRTRLYHNYGAIMRDQQASESWFAIRYSRFAFDHFQNDMGAFTFFAKGVPLMMDFGPMYSPENGQAVFHNRVVWDVREGTPKPCPGYGKDGCFYQGYSFFEHTVEPFTEKTEASLPGAGIIDHFGSVKAFASTSGADYLMGQVDVKAMLTMPYYPDKPEALKPDPNQKRDIKPTNPFAWQRRVLLNKAQMLNETSYLLVRDDFTAPCPPTMVSYWVMADELTWDANQAFAKGQFGVNLDIYFAQPEKPILSRWQWEHKNWGGERQLCLRLAQPDGKPVLAVLYPRTPDEAAPVFASLVGGNGVKISRGDATDYAFLATAPVRFSEGKVSFSGTAGSIRVGAAQTVLALADLGMASTSDVTLAATGAATLTMTGPALTLHTNGPAQTITLSGTRFARGVKINGKRVTPKKGAITLTVKEGEQTLTIQ
jgi:hypothetical protein